MLWLAPTLSLRPTPHLLFLLNVQTVVARYHLILQLIQHLLRENPLLHGQGAEAAEAISNTR